MLGDKHTVSVDRGELLSFVEYKLQRRHVGTQQQVRDNRLSDEVRPGRYPVVNVRTEITIRPPVKTTFHDMGEIVGRDVLAEIVAFIYRGPQLAGLWLECHAYRVSQPAGVDSHVLPIRVRNQDRGTAGIGLD